MLRRLFPSPAIIAFYSPDAHPTRWGVRTCPPTAERRCVLRLQKPASFTFHLQILSGNRMVLGASGVRRRFFRQKSGPNTQFGCRVEKLMHYSGRSNKLLYDSLRANCIKAAKNYERSDLASGMLAILQELHDSTKLSSVEIKQRALAAGD